MAERTTSRTIVFARPFVLQGLAGMQPAGEYVVETHEERLEGLSFAVWLRRSTVIRLQPRPGLTMTATVDPAEIETVLTRDGMAESARHESPERGTNRTDRRTMLDGLKLTKHARRASERTMSG